MPKFKSSPISKLLQTRDTTWAAPMPGERFVVFNQDPSSGAALEGEFDICPGQLVYLSGTAVSADQPLPLSMQRSGPE